MMTALAVEIRKLNRSLALLLALAAPSLIGIFAFFNISRFDRPGPWDQWLTTSVGIWAFFMLPMSVTALTALVAQMEHAPRAWGERGEARVRAPRGPRSPGDLTLRPARGCQPEPATAGLVAV